MDTFGEWLQKQRNHRRLTREEFAKRVGCSVAMLRKIEYGERRPSTQIAELIANALEIPASEQETFVRVARGELRTDRVSHLSSLTETPSAISDQHKSHNNLPVLPTPLIGRTYELKELSRLLRDPDCRLLTLVGPGGIGKTRLAIESASTIQDNFEGGVYFVPLAPVNSSRFIIPVIADSIGFSFQSANLDDPKTQLFSFLREKQILLLIDNLEHLLNEPDIEMFSELLAMVPKVKLLITSREPLNLQAEWVFDVQGLPVPNDPQTEAIIQDTSIELFIQRARRAYAGFSASPDDFQAIVRICQLVDGMPLAIELAAAWVRTLSCEVIAREIEKGLDFLHTSVRDLPARHRSMRAVFDHSWKLLSEEEQQVLLRLSVFRGGFRREAAEQVAEAKLAVLSMLVTKSLVRHSGTGRYDLHELIRQFATDQFVNQPEDQTATQAYHCDYYLTFFGNSDERLRSSAQSIALSELTAEMDNFRAAWDRAVLQGQFALIEKTLGTFAILYDIRGWYREGLDSLDRAIEALEMVNRQSAPIRTNQIAFGHLLATRSFMAYGLAQHEQAQLMLERSLTILRPFNEPRIFIEATILLGAEMLVMGNYSRALDLLDEGLEIARDIGDRWIIAGCLTEKAKLALMIDDAEEAYEQICFAVTEWRNIGAPYSIAFGLILLSQSASALGRYNEAQIALEESILLINSIGDRWGLGLAYRGLGLVAQAQGNHTRAVEMFRKGVDIFNELGHRTSAAQGLALMGRSFLAIGDDAEANRVWGESLRIANETRGVFIALEALAGFASIQAKKGDSELALELLLIVLSNPACTQETKKHATRLRADLEAQLSQQQLESIQMRANAKTYEDIVGDLIK